MVRHKHFFEKHIFFQISVGVAACVVVRVLAAWCVCVGVCVGLGAGVWAHGCAGCVGVGAVFVNFELWSVFSFEF